MHAAKATLLRSVHSFFERRNQSSSAFFSFSQLVFFLSAAGRARLLITAVVTRRPKEMTDTLGVLACTSTAAPRTRCTGREGACTAASHYGLVPSSAQVVRVFLRSILSPLTVAHTSSSIMSTCVLIFLVWRPTLSTPRARHEDYKYHRL